jgi:DnaJ-domain-containing protein 1
LKRPGPWSTVASIATAAEAVAATLGQNLKEKRVDQIFERLERLVRAWTNLSGDGSASASSSGYGRSARGSGDPDLDAAMAELDDYLDTSKTDTERREAQEAAARVSAEASARAEAERRARSSGSARAGGYYDRGTSAVIEDAYRYLGLAPYAPFPEVKNAYRKLLLKYHPDRNSSTPEALKRATETSTRINAAYQIIETFEAAKASK